MTVHKRPWEDLERLLDSGDEDGAKAFLVGLNIQDAVRAVLRLDRERQTAMLSSIDPEEAADLVEQMPDSEAADLMERVSPQQAAAILEEMHSDEQADVLAELGDREAEAILSAMDPQDARAARILSKYAPDVAGGLMVTEYLSYPEKTTVSRVAGDMREQADAYRDYDVQYVYVTTAGGNLSGVLRLRDLLLAPGNRPIREVMIPDPLTVREDDPLDELRGFFDDHDFVGVPVVDSRRHLVGVVLRTDVEEALVDRSDSDYRKTQGIVGGEELRSMPVLLRSRRRLSWLSINIVLNVIAASVIAFYQETLAAVIALAVFLPIISDMSGCSGNQAVAVSMRELTLGVVRPRELRRVWLHEMAVGAINGLALGILLGGVAILWKGNVVLGIVVAVAMAINTVVAVSIGGTVPLILRRLGKDPALASGPILTTITDMCGFFILLSLSSLLLSRLTG